MTQSISANGGPATPSSEIPLDRSKAIHHIALHMTPEQAEKGRQLGIARSRVTRRLRAAQKAVDQLVAANLQLSQLTGVTAAVVQFNCGIYMPGSLKKRDDCIDLSGEEKTDQTPFQGSSPARVRARKGRVLEDPGPPEFQAFYDAYPWRTARKVALAAWRKIDPSPELQARIMEALRLQRQVNFAGPGAPSPPHPSVWLNGERWTDEIKPPKSFQKPSQADTVRAWQASVQERLKNGFAAAGDDNPDRWSSQRGFHRQTHDPGADGPLPLAPGCD